MKQLKTNRAALMACAALLACTGCHSDSWDDVDGKAPTLTLQTQHERTETGRSFTIAGKVADADGIASIDLVCHDMNLNKHIDIIAIYGEPLKEYDLDYSFKLQGRETGEDFTIDVTVTDVGGRKQTGSMRVTLDGDFQAPFFTAAPDKEVSVLVKAKTAFNLQFTVEDNRVVDYVEIDLADISAGEANPVAIDGFPRRVEGGQSTLAFAEKIELPAKEATLLATITAYDREANEPAHSVSVTSRINVGELADYDKLWLCDVADAAALNSDVFGVPMLVDHVGPYKYRARYYNEKAGTEICFLAQKTDFGPICFAPSADDPSTLGDNPEEVTRLKLDKGGVYYLIDFDTMNRTWTTSTYTVAEAVDPVMHLHYGQDDLNTWWETNNLGDIWWQEFYFGPASGPGDVMRMTQDKANPHIYVMEDWKLETGEEMNFILHNWHSHGWWNFVTWRVDDSKEPEKFMYYGNLHPATPHYESNEDWFRYRYEGVDGFDLGRWGDESYRKEFIPDNWVKPTVAAGGKYKLIFDAHLERARLVPQQ